MASVLGVDPGACGAAALVSGSVVSSWWAWSPSRGGWRVRCSGAEPWRVESMHGLGERLALCVGLRGEGRVPVVVEGLFAAHGNTAAAKGRRRSVVALAESCGELLGPLRLCALGEPQRPRAAEWRSAVLGVGPQTSAAAAEEYAVEWARRTLRWVAPPEGLTQAELGAVCEAAAMAVWGAGGRRG